MIDIHCHILDGVDDGSYCLPESVEMARIACESGTRTIVATPHANAPGTSGNAWGETLGKKLATLNEKLQTERIPVRVCPGQEVYCAGDVVSLLRKGSVITLNASRYLLIEFDFFAHSDTILDQCDELIAAGTVPVIAHPERYEALKENEQTAYRLKRRGCLMQLNSGSLFGVFGRSAQRTAHDFLAESLADFIASDAHSPYVRTPFMADAHEMVSEMYSLDYAELLFRENPLLLVNGKEIKTFY
ncbi:MAG: tyrosine protein phosphatase [Clostridia bacterium]|nr:tyrosine protein phosphatase [Clostridia bacterium]